MVTKEDSKISRQKREWESKTLKKTLDKCIKSKRIEMNGTGLIKITNWEKYQLEYDRQKKSRQKKLDDDPDKYIKGKYGHMVRR